MLRMDTQRWLSIHGICNALEMTPDKIRRLVKKGLLQRLGEGPDARYLDPGPEYAERMRLAMGMEMTTPLGAKFLFTTREVATIMQWSFRHAITRLTKVPSFRTKGSLNLYSAADVRDMLWKRHGRKLADRKAPFLMPEILEFFQRYYDSETAMIPTDAVFREDEEFQKKLNWILKQPNKEVMLADLLQKMDLAKKVLTK